MDKYSALRRNLRITARMKLWRNSLKVSFSFDFLYPCLICRNDLSQMGQFKALQFGSSFRCLFWLIRRSLFAMRNFRLYLVGSYLLFSWTSQNWTNNQFEAFPLPFGPCPKTNITMFAIEMLECSLVFISFCNSFKL